MQRNNFFFYSLTHEWLADLDVEKTMNHNYPFQSSLHSGAERWGNIFWVLFWYDQCLADLDVQKSKVLWRYPSCKAHWDSVCRAHYSYSNHMTCTIKLCWINIICPSFTISYTAIVNIVWSTIDSVNDCLNSINNFNFKIMTKHWWLHQT